MTGKEMSSAQRIRATVGKAWPTCDLGDTVELPTVDEAGRECSGKGQGSLWHSQQVPQEQRRGAFQALELVVSGVCGLRPAQLRRLRLPGLCIPHF